MSHVTHTINLGILAHVDAGKTSLTERLLYEAGAISAPGSVDDGTTRTDSMDIERRGGITVRTNVASFAVGDVQVNLIDTPGHSDFIAEVERSLAVLDAAVLVVSAVEGVQSQTVVLWRALRRLAVPTLIFINKIDRSGADPARVLAEIGRRLTAPAGARTLPLTDVVAPGTANAATRPVPLTDSRAIDVLAMLDDRVLRAAPWTGRAVTGWTLRSARAQVRRCHLVPVAAGSALTGSGVPDLLATLPTLLPWARESACALSGVVYKIEHAERGRLAHCRIFGGELRVRDRAAAGRGGPGSSRRWNGPPRRAGPRPAPPPPATSSGSGASPRPPSAPGSARPFPAGSPASSRAPRSSRWSTRSTAPSAGGCSPPSRSWRRRIR